MYMIARPSSFLKLLTCRGKERGCAREEPNWIAQSEMVNPAAHYFQVVRVWGPHLLSFLVVISIGRHIAHN